MKTGKVWGETTILLKTPFIEIHKLSIKPDAFCSLHKHEFKWNAFYVISGQLFIETHKNDYDLVDTTELNIGGFTSVKAGEFHKFYTKDKYCEALEIYYPEALSDDIVRKNVGGISMKMTFEPKSIEEITKAANSKKLSPEHD